MTLSAGVQQTAGILLLTIVAVEWGGWHLLGIVRGKADRTPFQERFERAGHAHAGVLVILSLVALIYADSIEMSGLVAVVAHNGIPLAAILMSAGFFVASAGQGRTQPNRFIAVLYLGVLSLTAGVVCLGVALLTSL